MTRAQYEEFFDLLDTIVSASEAAVEKRDRLVQAARELGEKAEMNLEEFVAWFPEDFEIT